MDSGPQGVQRAKNVQKKKITKDVNIKTAAVQSKVKKFECLGDRPLIPNEKCAKFLLFSFLSSTTKGFKNAQGLKHKQKIQKIQKISSQANNFFIH